MLAVLLVAWLFRITVFAPNEDVLTTAAITVVPGTLVVTVVGIFSVAGRGRKFYSLGG